MSNPAEKLALSLEILQNLQNEGKIVIRSANLARVDRERLLKNGFLQEVMKGWYIPTRPDQASGESTAWFASFWSFCAEYLQERFNKDWCLSPEQSLNLQVGNHTIPQQLIVYSPGGNNNINNLPWNTSILDVQMPLPLKRNLEQYNGLNIFTLPAALLACSAAFFRRNPPEVRAALAAVPDASEILNLLLDGGHTVIGGRLAGAFRNIGRDNIANNIMSAMKAAGYACREEDPFQLPTPIIFHKSDKSLYVNRMRMLWETMRQQVLDHFPKPAGMVLDIDSYLSHVQEIYVSDAYHSLSIEGYKVSKQLIEQVRLRSWNPHLIEKDKEYSDALAARGYWQAYQAVRKSLKRVLNGTNAGIVADEDHAIWYRELFAPSVTVGLLKPVDLAGYRNDQVYIRHSRHLPPNKKAMRELMPALFELLAEEKEPAVRVVLGHFFFVYIHPYMDGNGRIGRFLMNVMLASGGYPWTIIPISLRADYLAALEKASVENNIVPLSKLIAKLVRKSMTS